MINNKTLYSENTPSIQISRNQNLIGVGTMGMNDYNACSDRKVHKYRSFASPSLV